MSQILRLTGHRLTAVWDGHALTATHPDGPVVIRADTIRRVHHRQAGALFKGRLTVVTLDGRTHRLHYPRKQSAGWAELAVTLRGHVRG